MVVCDERFPLFAIRSRDWQPALPGVLVTGGVHGYKTSGLQGALWFCRRARRAVRWPHQLAGGALRQ
jgi:hypothetical protein